MSAAPDHLTSVKVRKTGPGTVQMSLPGAIAIAASQIPGLPIPIDADALSKLHLKPSYIGFSLAAETDALRRVSPEVSGANRLLLLSESRRWVMRDLRGPAAPRWAASLFRRFGSSSIEAWPENRWEAFALEALWAVCLDGVRPLPVYSRAADLQALMQGSVRAHPFG